MKETIEQTMTCCKCEQPATEVGIGGMVCNDHAETKHTPGPWRYHLGRGANPRFHIQDVGGYQIASTTELVRHKQAHEENEAREANARLIAAAPELLEALTALLEASETIDAYEDLLSEPERKARAAIAKATQP
jgi:hypothetical protein